MWPVIDVRHLVQRKGVGQLETVGHIAREGVHEDDRAKARLASADEFDLQPSPLPGVKPEVRPAGSARHHVQHDATAATGVEAQLRRSLEVRQAGVEGVERARLEVMIAWKGDPPLRRGGEGAPHAGVLLGLTMVGDVAG